MSQPKVYDLEERTFILAKDVRIWIKGLKLTIANQEDIRQLVRSSGSVGANYIEANEKLGDKDFIYRLKISRKEAKESAYWLRLIDATNDLSDTVKSEGIRLCNEVNELRKILSTIINKRQL